MDKMIYTLLNNVETDFTSYDVNPLSDIEKKRLKLNLKKATGNQKSNRSKKISAAVACLAAVVLIGGISSTSWAQNLLSSVYETLLSSNRGDHTDEFYRAIGSNSTTIEEAVDRNENFDNAILTAEDQGIKIELKDIYVDGYNLYFTTVLTTDNEIMNQAEYIGDRTSDIDFKTDLDVSALYADGQKIDTRFSSLFYPMEDGSFIAMNNIDLFWLSKIRNIEFTEDTNFEVVLNYQNLGAYYVTDDYQIKVPETKSGLWNLKFTTLMDLSNQKAYDVNLKNNDTTLKNIVVDKACLYLQLDIPDVTEEPYNASYNNTDTLIYDDNGNLMQWRGGYTCENDDGSCTDYICLLYNGEKNITIQVFNKNGDGGLIAEINVDIPQE